MTFPNEFWLMLKISAAASTLSVLVTTMACITIMRAIGRADRRAMEYLAELDFRIGVIAKRLSGKSE